MIELIKQYGEMIIAMTGSIMFLMLVGYILLDRNGLLANMIFIWMNGGW